MRLRSVAVVLSAGTNGLGAVRSLEVKGIRSIVACKSRLDPAYLSRLPLDKVLIPDSLDFDCWLKEFVGSVKERADCIISTSDEFASALGRLSRARELSLPCVLPPDDLVDVLNDKRSELELMQRIGIPLPASVLHLHSLDKVVTALRFPIIVKPRTYQGYSVLGSKNRIVHNQQDFEFFLKEFESCLDGFIAQDVIPGDETCQWVCNATFDQHSEMISAFSFQRRGTVPYLYGVTTYAMSRHNPDVKALCSRIGLAMKYTGPAMFEFKVDPGSGQYCYIETNPRLGMCNWFDTRCGVNNVFNTYAVATGDRPEFNLDKQTEGRTYWNAILDLYARVRGKQSIRDILGVYAGNLPRHIVFPAWYWRDPAPVLAHPLSVIVKIANRLTEPLRRSR